MGICRYRSRMSRNILCIYPYILRTCAVKYLLYFESGFADLATQILYIFWLFGLHRRQVMQTRASRFTRSVCETFSFATSETLSINSGNRLMQAVANVRYIMCNICFVFEWCLTKHWSRMISIQKTFPSGHCLTCQTQCFEPCFHIRRERFILLIYMKACS